MPKSTVVGAVVQGLKLSEYGVVEAKHVKAMKDVINICNIPFICRIITDSIDDSVVF